MSEFWSIDRCDLCERRFEDYTAEFVSQFENLGYHRCNERASTEDGEQPEYGNKYVGGETVIEESENMIEIRMPLDDGANPVYINGKKCWRWYQFDRFVTLRDVYGCESLGKFLEARKQ